MKNILIAGGSGFLGQVLKTYLIEKGCQVSILSRKPNRKEDVYWDGESLGPWISAVEGVDCLINLSGKSVDCRYTEANRKAILDSRIKSTKVLQEAIDKCKQKPKVWMNASSATIYVHSESVEMTEANGTIGDDFSMNVCKQWEQAFFESDIEGVRRIALRTSIVLGKNGGAMKKLLPMVRIGLGGKQGRGTQKVSWIHEIDFCEIIWFLLNSKYEGPINVTSPNPVDNKCFMKKVREKHGMHFGLNAPRVLLELATWVLRTETELVLKSRHVIPERLLKFGYKFRYPKLEYALRSL